MTPFWQVVRSNVVTAQWDTRWCSMLYSSTHLLLGILVVFSVYVFAIIDDSWTTWGLWVPSLCATENSDIIYSQPLGLLLCISCSVAFGSNNHDSCSTVLFITEKKSTCKWTCAVWSHVVQGSAVRAMLSYIFCIHLYRPMPLFCAHFPRSVLAQPVFVLMVVLCL